jgi:hypothetical protein
VRTNLLLQSNTFTNATWDKLGVTVTAGQAGYDGTNNATLITVTSAFPRLQQNIANTGLQTLSVYAKAGAYNYLFINSLQNGSGDNASFDLVAGTQIVSFTTQVSSSITSVGNGWWKIVIAFSNTTFGSIAFATSIDGTVPSWSTASAGSVLIQDAQIETGDIATDYIATTSAAVSVGPVSGLPRLDYLNSTCPRLLLEPQRTNLLQYSEQFDNAYWQKDPSASVVANAAISPDGYQNADRLNFAASGNAVYRAGFSLSGAHRFSIYLKAEGANIGKQIYLEIGGGGTSINVTLSGEWQRFTAVADNSSSVAIKQLNSAQANSVLAWGAQLELGAYATSYIPTTSAAVTRLKDNCIKTGASSLIGQTEGTVFVEFKMNGQSLNEDIYSNNKNLTGSISIQLGTNGQLQGYICFNGGFNSLLSSTGAIQIGQTYKIALAYKSGNSALYINGTQVATNSTAFAFTTTLDEIDIANNAVFFAHLNNKELKQVLQFKTRLTNAQLAELTTL